MLEDERPTLQRLAVHVAQGRRQGVTIANQVFRQWRHEAGRTTLNRFAEVELHCEACGVLRSFAHEGPVK
eukprot:3332307-Prymnesium_polylepis.1